MSLQRIQSRIARSLTISALLVFGVVPTTRGQNEATMTSTSAPKAVREGNRLLKAGDAASALEHYRQAETLQPDAREIAFDRGLGHFTLGDYDQAREAFEQAAGGESDALADDAIYSAGASEHAEALANEAQPQLALSKLESAMQRYQSVLSRRSDHLAARDANHKAAALWRTLKQQLEQQQQQQQQNNDQQDQNEEGEEQDNQEQQPSQQQKDDQQKEQPSAQDQEQQSQEQESQQEQSSSAEEQDQEEEQSKEEQAQRQEEKEQVSREQAERKLREMMQALRDRKKLKPEEVRKVPISSVDKDW